MFNFLKPTPPKSLGQLGEEVAQKEYKKRGCKIVAANFFNSKGKRVGEVDFIAVDKHVIYFVEVKTRAEEQAKFGTGSEAVDQFKQLKLLKAVKLFLLQNPKYLNFRPQIDVCEVIMSELDKQPKSVKIISNAVEDWN